jgi:hypothetical protein
MFLAWDWVQGRKRYLYLTSVLTQQLLNNRQILLMLVLLHVDLNRYTVTWFPVFLAFFINLRILECVSKLIMASI